MKKKGIGLGIIAVMTALSMTACGSEFPDLNSEQEEAVGEYAAVLLLKYDANNRSRLVDLSLLAQEETAPPEQQPTEPEQEGAKPVDDTPVIDNNGSGSGDDQSGSMNEVLELPEGIVIAYAGQEICSSYPGNDYVSVDAAAGKQLLVLKFLVENQTGQDQAIDLLSENVSYRVTINDSYTRNALPTGLLDDMSTYIGTLASGEQQSMVLIVEVDQDVADSVGSVDLNLKNELKTYTISVV